MAQALGLATRNLWRNRRRGAIAMFTIAAGVVAMVLADGFMQWIFWAMREGAIQSQLGHIQVVRPGYHQAGAANPYRYILSDTLPARTEIERLPGVQVLAPRLSVNGLISHGETTLAFLADGVDPAREGELSKAFVIQAGKGLSGVDADEVILGKGLARALGVEPGGTVALLVSPSTGGVNAVEARVAGIFHTANPAYDDIALRLPIGLAQRLMRVEGAHAWLLLLDDTDQTDRTLKWLRAAYVQAAGTLEFVPWYERADFYNKTVALFSSQMGALKLIIGAIIVLSISNLLVMNVLERTGEIGTLLAIGFRRGRILRMFALEGLVLGMAGGACGMVAGYGLAEAISAVGIPMPPPPGMDEGYLGEIRATPGVLAGAFTIALATTVLAGLYPAYKASRLNIVNALRHNI
jgi:putative ABC transport system permease protein